MKKRGMCLGVLTAFLLSASATFAAPSQPAVKPVVAKQQTTKRHPMSFLFVVSALHAELKDGVDGEHVLVFKRPDIKQIIMFSDRPYRVVKYLKGMELEKLWVEGKSSFIDSPPNASLVVDGQPTVVVTISAMEVSKESLSYRVKLTKGGVLPPLSTPLSHVSLTVDDKALMWTCKDLYNPNDMDAYNDAGCPPVSDKPLVNVLTYSQCYNDKKASVGCDSQSCQGEEALCNTCQAVLNMSTGATKARVNYTCTSSSG
jgi:hypothetical protein